MILYTYYFYHHMSPEFPRKEILKSINEHDWDKFTQFYQAWGGEWVDDDGYNWFYLPDDISEERDVVGGSLYRRIPLTKENFMKINCADCECG